MRGRFSPNTATLYVHTRAHAHPPTWIPAVYLFIPDCWPNCTRTLFQHGSGGAGDGVALVVTALVAAGVPIYLVMKKGGKGDSKRRKGVGGAHLSQLKEDRQIFAQLQAAREAAIKQMEEEGDDDRRRGGGRTEGEGEEEEEEEEGKTERRKIGGGDNALKCELCRKKFKSDKQLEQHMV